MSVDINQLDGFIWMNGEIVPFGAARVHILTHGLHYGSCVFEGQRAYNGNIFKLHEHTDRLIFSGKELGFNLPYTADEINRACKQVLEINNLTNAYMRPVAWRGEEMGVSAQKTSINVAIAAWEWPSYFVPEERKKGIRLDIAKYRRPSPDTIPCHAKASGLYMICTLSKHDAEAKGYADAMMLDYRGQVAETTGANMFFIKNGEIHTPTPDCFLDGITRRTVIKLARAKGVSVTERVIMPEELTDFEECFITGTAAEVTPVSEIGPYFFTPTDISLSLMEDYDALVRQPA